MRIEGEKALITGGAEGLGFSLAKEFLTRGASEVIICGRNFDKLGAASKKLKDSKLKIVVCDVSNPGSVDAMATSIDRIGILVNNAGVFLDGNLEGYSDEDISKVIDSNLKGTIFVTKAFLPRMLRDKKGVIVNISSTSGLDPRHNQSVYVASKYGVTGFTRTLRLDLEGTGVRVIGVYPGGMATKLFEKAGSTIDSGEFIPTDEMAKQIVANLETKSPMVVDEIVIRREKRS